MSRTLDTDRSIAHGGAAPTPSLPAAVDLPWLLARRALGLAHDRGVSITEGIEHLTRLAGLRDLPLRLALAHLRLGDTPDAASEHACTLLERAIDAVTVGA